MSWGVVVSALFLYAGGLSERSRGVAVLDLCNTLLHNDFHSFQPLHATLVQHEIPNHDPVHPGLHSKYDPAKLEYREKLYYLAYSGKIHCPEDGCFKSLKIIFWRNTVF